jgi:catechol 2,3-dioxygenase-like lactoylglutathione lyase family enzyme
MKVLSSNAVFHVIDLRRAIAFYTELLGFNLDFEYGTPPTYAGLSLGIVCLHLSCNYPYKNNTGHGNLYVICDEVQTVNQRCLDKEVLFYSHLAERDYGLIDFAIQDPDGNQIGFGAELQKGAG